jgi:hypothetical protein
MGFLKELNFVHNLGLRAQVFGKGFKILFDKGVEKIADLREYLLRSTSLLALLNAKS